MELIEKVFESAKRATEGGSTVPMHMFIERMDDPANRTPKGTYKKWIEARGLGAQIDLYQVGQNTWHPGARELDSIRSSYFTLRGSRTDYAGHTVLHASDTELMVSYKWGDTTHYSFYIVES